MSAPDPHRARGALVIGVFVAILSLRIFFCFQVPLVTTDTFRQLGFASHALDADQKFYETAPRDYRPEVWTFAWDQERYVYPPAALMFFYGFSLLGLGIFWVKLAVTLLEVVNAYLLWRSVNVWAALLYFAAPISIWYASHEGTFEALQVLLIFTTILCVRRRHWFLSGLALALAIQVKLYGILLLPWVLQVWWSQQRGGSDGRSAFIRLAGGTLCGFAVFAGFYLETPLLLLRPLSEISVDYSQFFWNPFDTSRTLWVPRWLLVWNGAFTYAALGLLLATAIIALRRRQGVSKYFPALAFWLLLKSVRSTQFWYSAVAPAFLLCFAERKRLICLLLALHALQGARSGMLLTGNSFGYRETHEHRLMMKQCMLRCDFEADAWRKQSSAQEGVSLPAVLVLAKPELMNPEPMNSESTQRTM